MSDSLGLWHRSVDTSVCVCRIRAPSPASGRISTSNSSLCFAMEMCGSWSSSMLPATHNARDRAITSLAVEYPKVCQYIGVHAASCVMPHGHTSTHPCIDASMCASIHVHTGAAAVALAIQHHAACGAIVTDDQTTISELNKSYLQVSVMHRAVVDCRPCQC